MMEEGKSSIRSLKDRWDFSNWPQMTSNDLCGQNDIYYVALGYNMSMYAKNCISVCIFHNLIDWPRFYLFWPLVAYNVNRINFSTSGDMHMYIIVVRYQYNWFCKTLTKVGYFSILWEHVLCQIYWMCTGCLKCH